MKTKQIEVQFKSAELGDLSNITELGARATFDEDTAIIACDENQLDEIEDLLESDDNVSSYFVVA